MLEIKSIKTKYKNITFRSRIEANFAVLFDLLKLKWQYEPKKFDLKVIRYIPDFWIDSLNLWIEIKGKYPIEEEELKAKLLSKQDNNPVFIFWGEMRPPSFYKNLKYSSGVIGIKYENGIKDEKLWTFHSDRNKNIFIDFIYYDDKILYWNESIDNEQIKKNHNFSFRSEILKEAYKNSKEYIFDDTVKKLLTGIEYKRVIDKKWAELFYLNNIKFQYIPKLENTYISAFIIENTGEIFIFSEKFSNSEKNGLKNFGTLVDIPPTEDSLKIMNLLKD